MWLLKKSLRFHGLGAKQGYYDQRVTSLLNEPQPLPYRTLRKQKTRHTRRYL